MHNRLMRLIGNYPLTIYENRFFINYNINFEGRKIHYLLSPEDYLFNWSCIISTLCKSFQCQFDAKVLWIRTSCCRMFIFIIRSSEVKEDSLWSYQVIEGQGLVTHFVIL